MTADFLDKDSPKNELPFSINKISFAGWLGDFDLENRVETLSSISMVLKCLKQAPIETELRLFFLQKITPIIEQLSQQLQQDYKKSCFPFSEEDTLKLQLSADCAMEMAQNYSVLCERKEFKTKQLFTQQQKAQVIQSGIQFQGEQLLYKSLLYQKPEQGFWGLCFLFYLYAKQNDVLELEIDFRQTCFLNDFKLVLLFELSNVQQFNAEELIAVHGLLNRFSQYALLINEVPEKKFRGIPYINLRVDEPPSLPKKENIQQQPYLFYISSLNVIRTLLEQSTNKISLEGCYKSTLMRLIKALTMNEQRKSDRDSVDDKLYAIVGFDKVKHYFVAKNKSTKKALAPGEVRDLDFDIDENEMQHINPDEFRSEREANLTISTEFHILEHVDSSDIWMSRKQKAKQKANKPVANIGLVDKSSSGYRLSLKGVVTKVGDSIAVVISDDLVITVVRRIMQITADEIQVGVEVLGSDVELLNVVDRNSKSETALYLKSENNMESILIGVDDFQNEDYLFADLNEKRIRFHIDKQLFMSSTFRHLKVSLA